MTTHLFKHGNHYYAKSTVTEAHVRYDWSFEDTSQKELYPWYVWMQKPWGKETYEDAEWKSPSSHGRVSIDRYKDTVSGWDDGPFGEFPTKMMQTFRKLKINSVTIVLTLKSGKQLEYDVSNKEDKLLRGRSGKVMCYDATSINTIYRIYSEEDRYRVAYHFQAQDLRVGSNPSFNKMTEPLNQSFTQFDVMIDDAVDLYKLERETLEKLVEQYAQEKLDNFVESNL